ncbi:hypothetical protein [Burkholderia stagnalis]|uniref:hypothetical protein n=1 Tax=Burkholderia stagnalis TaxID=1503054 RepID=UPI0007600BAB|nr:hypothetical protein [Burkholderia stagnalis]KWN77094.1 hypothetical protein WT90_06950 [Burkholderia stagnalis]
MNDQQQSRADALTITEDARDGNWYEFTVNGHHGLIRVVARMEDDDEDYPLGKCVRDFLLAATPAEQPAAASASANETGAEGAKPVAWFIDWPDEPELGHYFAEEPCDPKYGRSRALGFIESRSPAMAAAAPADERAALEWAAGTLQAIVSASGVTERDRVSIGAVTKTISEVLDMADAALARAAASPAAEAVAIPVEWDQDAAIEALSDFPKGSIWYEFLKEVGFDPTSGLIYVLTVQGRAMLDQLKSAYFAAPQPAQADARDEEAYVAKRMTETLATVYATIIGDDPVDAEDGLNAIERVVRAAQVLRLEVDLYRAQADAPAEAREPVCKLCRSTGPDLPCAYPTEINRQQAKRIAELESRLSVNVDPHPDDVAVDSFAAVMKHKLALARDKGRGGWEACSPADLSRMLREHVEKGDPRDVANFCMMLWHHGSPIVRIAANMSPKDEQRVFALAANHDGFGDQKHFDFTGAELLEFARALLNGADQ